MTPTSTSGVNTDISLKDNISHNPSPIISNSDDTTGTQNDYCAICNGTGFVYPILASGQLDYSQVVPCQCQSKKLHNKKLEKLQQYSNIGSLSQLTFDKLASMKNKDGLSMQDSKVYQASKAFADHPEGWLMLIGPSGSGKTLLACAIVNQQLKSEQPAFYIGVSDLLDHLRSTYGPSSTISYDEFFEQVKNTPLLVLDDMRIETDTSWAKEKLEQLLNHRFNVRLATVITTDIPLNKLDDRLRIRFEDKYFCQIFTIGQRLSSRHLGDLPPGLLQSMSFSNFDHKRLELPLEQRQNLRQSLSIAKDFAKNPEGWLILQGVNGCGKTHLAASIVNYRLAQGSSSFFIFVPDLLDYLRSSFNNNSKIPYDEFFNLVKESPLLVLDDFGQQSSTPWAQEKLYQLINYRYNLRLPTVITTCLSLEEIETRISSRFVDPKLSLVFNIIAPDYRGDIGGS